MTVEEDTGDIFVLDSHYQNLDERPRVLQLDFDDATKGVTTVDAWSAVATTTPIPDNGDDVDDPNECQNPVGCDPRMYGIDIVTAPGNPLDDFIYVTDAYNRRNYRFRKQATGVLYDGTPSHYVDTFGLGQNGGDNRGIVVNEAANRVFSVDAENSQVDVFTMGTATSPPTYRESFGMEAAGAGNFTGGGRAIDIDGSGNVWVADFGGFETEKFRYTAGAATPSTSDTWASLLVAPTPPAKPPVGLLGQPRDVAVDDATGEVWVADAWNQRFSRFSATGVPMGQWGHRGPGGAFDMNYPRHIQIQPANTATMPGTDHPKRIWVSNERGHHLQVYNYPTSSAATCNNPTTDPTGACAPAYVAQVGLIGNDDIELNHFRWPVDIEFYTRANGTEVAVIGDRMASSVKFFNAVTFQEIPNPNDPDTSDDEAPMIPRPNHGLAIDQATGNVYVVNPNNDRIEVYDQSGVALNRYATSPTNPTLVNYFGSATQNNGTVQMTDPVDGVINNGIIYVSDEKLSRVLAFRISDGAKLGQWGGSFENQAVYNFSGAIGLDVRTCSCAENGYLYVTDTGNDRIQVFDPNLSKPTDTTNPSLPVVSTPAQAQANLTTLGPVSFTGTATDNIAVSQVEVSIQDVATGLWWDADTQSWETTKTGAITGWSGTGAASVSWRWTFLGVHAQGRYVAEFKTRDHNGNLSQTVVRTFAMPGATAPPIPPPTSQDTTRPDGIQTYPTQPPTMTLPAGDITFTGTASDNVGVTDVRFGIKRVSDGRWLQSLTSATSSAFPSSTFKTFSGVTVEPGGTTPPVVLSTPGGTTTNWSFTWANERPGVYQTYVEAQDAAGNVDSSKPQVTFNLADLTAPDTTVTSPAAAANVTTLPVNIAGSTTDDTGATTVRLSIRNATTSEYWTGLGWSATATTVEPTLGTLSSTFSRSWSYSFAPGGTTGPIDVTATATDAAGNVDATPATRSFTLAGAAATPPETQLAAPTNGSSVSAVPVDINGSATDDTSVGSVRLTIRNGAGQYWNGGSFQAGAITVNATLATPATPSTTWSYAFYPPGSGQYSVAAAAVDGSGATDPTPSSSTFTQTGLTDSVEPSAAITSPVHQGTATAGSVTLAGTATDNVGVTRVEVSIQNRTTSQFFNGSAWSTGFKWITAPPATLASPGASSTTWTYAFTTQSPAPAAGYRVQVRAFDAAANADVSPWPTTDFSVTVPAPTPADTAVTAPVEGATVAAPVTITGTATDDTSVGTVGLVIRNSGGQYWTGSAWQAGAAGVAAAVTGAGTPSASWSYGFTPGVNGSYTVAATAADSAGTADASPATVGFTVTGSTDTVAPDTAVSTPAQGATVPAGAVTITGTATDNVGVQRVEVSLYDRTSGRYWNGTAFVTGFRWVPATASLVSPGAASTGWSFVWNVSGGSGSYRVQTRATDLAGNVETTFYTRQFSQ